MSMSSEAKVVFVEFSGETGDRIFMVGSGLGAVLADTQSGTGFGAFKLTNHRLVSEEDVRAAANFGTLDNGISSVQSGLVRSYYVGSARPAP